MCAVPALVHSPRARCRDLLAAAGRARLLQKVLADTNFLVVGQTTGPELTALIQAAYGKRPLVKCTDRCGWLGRAPPGRHPARGVLLCACVCVIC